MSELLTLAEASRLTGIEASVLRRQCAAGKLRARLMGKTWLVLATDLHSYLESRGWRGKRLPASYTAPEVR